MSRVEQTRRNEQPRQSQPRDREPHPKTENPGHTPSKAEGDEATVDEALKNSETRR